MRNRRTAIAVALALPLASIAVMATIVERPFLNLWPGRGAPSRAAVAIRDDVVPFQKWGTRSFTLPYLERGYDRVWYFTERRGSDARERFLDAVAEACRTQEIVDLFLLAHGNDYVSLVARLDPALTSHLRLVYNTGCGDASQSGRWLALGADTYVGHAGTSESPVFYVYFLRRWIDGWSAVDAVGAANVETERILAIVGTAAMTHDQTDAMIAGSRAELAGRGDSRIGASPS